MDLVKSALHQAMEKQAADRALKNVRKALAAGGIEAADALAKRYAARGALRMTSAGSQLKPGKGMHGLLGAGAEGPAAAIIGAHDVNHGGVAVRKAFDPRGFFGTAHLPDKLEAAEAVRGNPHFAQRFGSGPAREKGGMPFVHNEYVGGEGISDWRNRKLKEIWQLGERATYANPVGLSGRVQHGLGRAKRALTAAHDLMKTQYALHKAEHQAGGKKFGLLDIALNPGNVKMVGDSPKVIDFLAAHRGKLPAAAEAVQRGAGPEAVWRAGGIKVNPGALFANKKPEDILKNLGSGSRQAKKIRGPK